MRPKGERLQTLAPIRERLETLVARHPLLPLLMLMLATARSAKRWRMESMRSPRVSRL